MSTPNRHDSDGIDDAVEPRIRQRDEQSWDVGQAAPLDHAPRSGSQAPASAVEQPQAAFDLLSTTLGRMYSVGANTSAAGVAARMKQEDPGFSVRGAGFPTFRRFLEAARTAGLVAVDEVPGASDVVVRFPTGSEPEQPMAALAPRPGARVRLRRDFWSALSDYGRPGPYLYDPGTGVLNPPGAVGPGEGTGTVPLTPPGHDELRGWMTAFAARTGPGAFSDELESCVAADDGGASFRAFMQNNQNAGRRWRRFLREKIVTFALEWATLNGLPSSTVVAAPATPSGPRADAGAPTRDAAASSATPIHAGLGADAYDAEVRSRLVSAVREMPLADLLKLPIPVEYLLRR